MSSSYKSSVQLQTKKASVTSVTLGLSGTNDPSEARYWAQHFDLGGNVVDPTKKKYASPKSAQFQGPSSNAIVSQVVFGPPAFGASPPLAVVSGPRVGLYATAGNSTLGRTLRAPGKTCTVAPDRQVGTGGHPALCAEYRADGRLIAVGTDAGHVKIADATSRATLTTFSTPQSKLPIRTLHWLRNGKQIVAGGDDGVVRLWSLDTSALDKEATRTFVGHGDTVRSLAMWEPKAHDDYKQVAISGSYDHTIRVWNLDEEEEEERACLGIMDHGAPVEALLLMPNNNKNANPWLLSAGGTEIKVWNFLTGQCHATLKTMHSKTITSMVSMTRTMNGNERVWRILTAALDGLIRIHTWSSSKGEIKYIHGVKLADPITSLATNETYNRLAIGTTTGDVIFRQEGTPVQAKRKQTPAAGTYAFFMRGQNAVARADDFVVHESKKRKLQGFDVALKQFRYGDALDEALESRNPQSVLAVLEELGRRRGLSIALSNRDEQSLEPILAFTVRYISRPQSSSLLIGVARMLCDIYEGVTGESEIIDELFGKLKSVVHEELTVQKSLLRISGMLGALITVQQQDED